MWLKKPFLRSFFLCLDPVHDQQKQQISQVLGPHANIEPAWLWEMAPPEWRAHVSMVRSYLLFKKMQLVLNKNRFSIFNNSGGASGSQHCLPPGKQSFLDWYDLDLVPVWCSRPPLHPCCGAAAGQLMDICCHPTVGIALKGAVAATFSQDTHSMYIYMH